MTEKYALSHIETVQCAFASHCLHLFRSKNRKWTASCLARTRHERCGRARMTKVLWQMIIWSSAVAFVRHTYKIVLVSLVGHGQLKVK